MLMLLYDSVNIVVSGVKFCAVMGQVRRKELQSFTLQQLDCVKRKTHRCTILLKDKNCPKRRVSW